MSNTLPCISFNVIYICKTYLLYMKQCFIINLPTLAATGVYNVFPPKLSQQFTVLFNFIVISSLIAMYASNIVTIKVL